jgi:hypothetical protein
MSKNKYTDYYIKKFLESGGLKISDFFISESRSGYLICYWGENGQRGDLLIEDDDLFEYAKSYLLKSGAKIIKLEDQIKGKT